MYLHVVLHHDMLKYTCVLTLKVPCLYTPSKCVRWVWWSCVHVNVHVPMYMYMQLSSNNFVGILTCVYRTF